MTAQKKYLRDEPSHRDRAKTSGKDADVAPREMVKKDSRLVLPIVVFGFSCCWAVTFISAFSFAYTPIDQFSALTRSIARVGYLGGIVAGQMGIYLLLARNTHLRERSFRGPLAISSCCMLFVIIVAHSILSITGFPLVILVAILVLAGVWQGIFHVLWAETFMQLQLESPEMQVSLSVIIGALLFVATTLLARGSSLFALLLLACFSLACYLCNLPDASPVEGISFRVSRKLSKDLHKFNVTLVVFGAVLGTGIYACMGTSLPYYVSYPLTGLAICSGVLVLYITARRTGRIFSFNELITALFPCIAVVLVLLVLVPDNLSWYIYLCLLPLLTIFDTSSFTFLFSLAKDLKIYPLSFITRGRMYVQAGMFIAGLANLLVVYCLSLSFNKSFLIPLVLVVFLFILVVVSGKIDVTPGELKNEDRARTSAQDLLEMKRRVFHEDYDLSERELDVLVLMMKGYTAGAIAEELVISTNTVKSHTLHIYRKMGINSKQEAVKLWNSVS